MFSFQCLQCFHEYGFPIILPIWSIFYQISSQFDSGVYFDIFNYNQIQNDLALICSGIIEKSKSIRSKIIALLFLCQNVEAISGSINKNINQTLPSGGIHTLHFLEVVWCFHVFMFLSL
jgi:hypothetical protein